MSLRPHYRGTVLCAALAVIAVPSATAGAAELTLAGCITAGNSPAQGCTDLGPSVGALNDARSVAVAPDGRSVYVASFDSDAIAHLRRDPSTGALSFAGCVTAGDTPASGCTDASARTNALDSLRALAVSPDGTSVYAISRHRDAIAHLTRNPTTGQLAFAGCVTAGDTPAFGCTDSSARTNALDSPRGLAVSPDGTSVYTTSRDKDALVHFTRGGGGALGLASCVTAGDSPATGCTDSSAGTNALDAPHAVVVAPDGASVYTASSDKGAVAHFGRDAGSGTVAFADCTTTNPATTGCTNLSASSNALNALEALAVSPDGASVYAGSGGRDALTRLSASASPGPLAFASCTSSDALTTGCTNIAAATDGLDLPRALAADPGSRGVYAASADQDAVVALTRDAGTDTLAFAGCVTAGDSPARGCADFSARTNALDSLYGIAASPDGADLYTVSAARDAIAHLTFRAAPPPGSLAGSPPPGTRPGEGPAGGGALRIRSSSVRLTRRGVAALRLSCPASRRTACAGRLALRARLAVRQRPRKLRTVRLADKAFVIARGRTVLVNVRVTRSGRRLVARRRTLRVRAGATERDRAGRATTVTRTITLRAPKPRRASPAPRGA